MQNADYSTINTYIFDVSWHDDISVTRNNPTDCDITINYDNAEACITNTSNTNQCLGNGCQPTPNPTQKPTIPTKNQTKIRTSGPTNIPSLQPPKYPTKYPSAIPTKIPSKKS